MNYFLCYIAGIGMALLLGGCQGITVDEMRSATPIYSESSVSSLNTVFACFASELNKFRGDGRMLILTYPEGAKAEFSIGAMQAGNFKHYYLVSLSRSSEATNTEIRRSPRDYYPLPEADLVRTANKCT